MASSQSDPTAPGRRPRRARRLPLVERRRIERRNARVRVAARTRVALAPAQRARDPLARTVSPAGRVLRALGAILGSTAVHVGIVALGFALSGMEVGRRDSFKQEVTIEVRPPPPPPPEPEVEPTPPPPPPEPPKVVKRERPRPVPEPEPPPPEPKTPPPRVVGVNYESTTEGGGGPAFAVGNTRQGITNERAVDPKEVPSEPPPSEPTAGTNKVATRVPVAGVTLSQPRRVRPCKLVYPETLKAQGIEADVPVLVSLDARGKVTGVRVLKEPPYPEFAESARTCARAEEYEPAAKNGVPIPFSFSFTYRFRLEDQ